MITYLINTKDISYLKIKYMFIYLEYFINFNFKRQYILINYIR